MNKDYIFARNIDLKSNIITNTHNYAFESAKKNHVKWLSTPNYPWTKKLQAKKKSINNIEEFKLSFLYNHGGRKFNNSKIVYDTFPYTNYLTRYFDNINYKELENSDVFFCGSLSLFSIHKILKPKKLVYNAHDLFAFYPGVSKSIKEIESSIIQSSDLVVTTSEMTKNVLKNTYNIGNNKIINLNHGINLEEFISNEVALDLPQIDTPIAIFVGTVSMLNKDLMNIVIKLLPEITFLIIGPYNKQDETFYLNFDNVLLIGSRKRSDLIKYYNIASVGLINYDFHLKENRILGTNPMKRYDYSAAGLQIVSTSLREYEINPSPMYIEDNPKLYATAIKNAIENPKFTKEEIIEFAKKNQWKHKFLKIEECLH